MRHLDCLPEAPNARWQTYAVPRTLKFWRSGFCHPSVEETCGSKDFDLNLPVVFDALMTEPNSLRPADQSQLAGEEGGLLSRKVECCRTLKGIEDA
ncbi:hypothetical protein BN77_p2140040 [Rhizobium mesoamericanum STM3625]|uniref:Uncharacterized protein n=1 Tax=Rhizobium mesoamericanum STM3625 TaxID=1211777 RepID=K0Q6J0_9HYPH|nr:hypothetical protein BN77_p2140040 [Rhizobium mesoamericanum STM3625]